MSRSWLRYPARTVGRIPPCPSGLPRFASVDRALSALTSAVWAAQIAAIACQQCGGAHHVPLDASASNSEAKGTSA